MGAAPDRCGRERPDSEREGERAGAAGGAYEGWIAESSFNQWQHFIAFVILTLGLGLYGLFYWHMVNVGVH